MTEEASAGTDGRKRRNWPLSVQLLVIFMIYAGLHLVPGVGMILLVLGSFLLLPLLLLGVVLAILHDVWYKRIHPLWAIIPILVVSGHVLNRWRSSASIETIRSDALRGIMPLRGWDGRVLLLTGDGQFLAAAALGQLGIEKFQFGADGRPTRTSFLAHQPICSDTASRVPAQSPEPDAIIVHPTEGRTPYTTGDCVITLSTGVDPDAARVDLEGPLEKGRLHGMSATWQVTRITLPDGRSSSFRHGSVPSSSTLPLQLSMGRDEFPWKRDSMASFLSHGSFDRAGVRGALQVLGFERKQRMVGRKRNIPESFYDRPKAFLDPADARRMIASALAAQAVRNAESDAAMIAWVEETLVAERDGCPKSGGDVGSNRERTNELLKPLLPRIARALREDTRISEMQQSPGRTCAWNLVEAVSRLDPAVLRTVGPDLREAMSRPGHLRMRGIDTPESHARIIAAVGSVDELSMIRYSWYLRIQREGAAIMRQTPPGMPMPTFTPPPPYWEEPEFQKALVTGIPG